MDAFFGYCSEGHLHPIRNEYTGMAKNQKSLFKTSMFRDDYVKEESIKDNWLIPLPPTNCPKLADFLPFERRTSRINAIPRDPVIIPFDSNQAREKRTAVAFLIQFESHRDRQTETKEQGKTRLYNFIVDAYPELTSENSHELSYEKLREMFLRKFWSIEDQERIHEEFLRSKYPMSGEQGVSDYVYHWVNRLTYSTVFLTRNIARELAERIPPRYEPIMRKFYDGARWYMVYEKIKDFEETMSVTFEETGSGEPQRDTQTCDTGVYHVLWSIMIAAVTLGVGFTFYIFYVYFRRK